MNGSERNISNRIGILGACGIVILRVIFGVDEYVRFAI